MRRIWRLFRLFVGACVLLQSTISAGEESISCVSLPFRATRIGSSFAAEIKGVDLETVDDAAFALIDKYLIQHRVLIFPNQSGLSVEGQRRFTQRWGPLQVHVEAVAHLPGYEDVNVVSNMKSNATGHFIGLNGEHVENYHTDLSWSEMPNLVTLLRSEIRPLVGGDTIYLDTITAYKELPTEWKERLAGRTTHNSYLKFRDFVPGVSDEVHEYLLKGHDHTLISTHPVTGKKNIFANPGHSVRVNGVSSEESEQILSFIFSHVDQDRFKYVHKWQDGDAVLWDNRAVQHKATPAPAEPRKLIRTTVVNSDIPRENLLVPVAEGSWKPPCIDTLMVGSTLSHEL
jgi:taurine dioxygenase